MSDTLSPSVGGAEAADDASAQIDAPSRSCAQDMDRFLREIEARAYRIAMLGLRNRDDALDAVQDAMLRLVRRYGRRPSDEWRPLFYRILQNRVRDLQRRRRFRTAVLGLFTDADDGREPIDEAPGPAHADPLEQTSATSAMAALEQALAALPARQREAFVLRCLEGLDVAETAAAMRCTEGSVKTHYSRAVHRLRALLGAHIGGEG
ncbi:MAG TPA: RNA polymerase sigma factor [Gammaproteobacteria bacterium]